jgi:hypothetical protein
VITNIEKQYFINLLNRDGYVLNFSTYSFNVFTINSIGIALCNHYGLSKGKSLEAFLVECSPDQAKKLLTDLVNYYEANCHNEIEQKDKKYYGLYVKCREILDRESISSTAVTSAIFDDLESAFSTEYMSDQLQRCLHEANVNPTEAIGKAKEVLESCCKTILQERRFQEQIPTNLNKLTKETFKILGISSESVNVERPEGRLIIGLLAHLAGVVSCMAELRNYYGSGHGRNAQYQGLTKRHACLAVNISFSLMQYLWETHDERREEIDIL